MSKTVRYILIAGFVTLVVYPLSYAPVSRVALGESQLTYYEPTGDPFWAILYRPVLLLIDHTPATTPLLWWSDLWGVGPQHRWDHIYRLCGNRWRGMTLDVF